MRFIMPLLSIVSLGLGACAKESPGCDALAARLCDANAERCDAARTWVDAQGAGDAAARGEACTQMLKDPQALAAYLERFAATGATAVTPDAPRPATATTPDRAPAKAKPTTKDEIRNFGDNVEEIGTVGEKAGEAIDKIGDAFKRKGDTNP
jgi:hypothetical protein